MEIRILGCYGGEAKGFRSPSFLINGEVVIDAGAITSTLTIEEQRNLKHILITHAHLDHIKDIPFVADNIIGNHKEPLNIVAEKRVLKGIESHIMNDYIWPDFRILPSRKNPVIKFLSIKVDKVYEINSLKIKATRTNHVVDSVGYFISDGKSAVGFSGDTFTTDKFWEEANKTKLLKAIFIETSFPSFLENIARTSLHLTPALLKEELKKLKKKVDIYVYHLKPNFVDTLKKELKEINYPNLYLAEQESIIKI